MKGVQANFAAQVRVFGHDALDLTAHASYPSASVRIPNTEDRGVCLYVGTGGDVQVKLEGGDTVVTFKNVPDGHFLPILATHWVGGTGADVLAIY